MSEAQDDRRSSGGLRSGLSDCDEASVGVIEGLTEAAVLGGEGGDSFTKGRGLGDGRFETSVEFGN